MASPTTIYSAKDEQSLMADIWSRDIKNDPYAFVMFALPWGQKGTPLEKYSGPRKWQKKKLLEIKQHIADNNNKAIQKILFELMRDATVSGRGIGKSAFVSWLILFFLSTRLGCTVIVTANTEAQLKTKTWAEVKRWHTMLINSHWFEANAMSIRPAPWFKERLEKELKISTGYYYAEAILWSEDNPDAFAGAHNPLGMILIFDEASGIPAAIWTVSEGFFTEEDCPDRFWFVFSNGRRNTGTFFECFHKNRDLWRRTQIDGRSVEGTDKKVYENIIKQYGPDSDEARTEVYGQFPGTGDRQFISSALVDAAKERVLEDDKWAPLVMGVDPARFGRDKTVIRFRQGRNWRVIPPIKLKGKDNMEVADECARAIDLYNPDAVFIDAGNGTGIIDRLRQMGYKVVEVWFGSKSPLPQYANFRTYIWAQMREALAGACVDDDPDLYTDLTAPEKHFMTGTDKEMLESKEDLKARGYASPDDGDAVACTFAARVARKDGTATRHGRRGGKERVAPGTNYKVI